jgi:hypothetical protein
MKSNTKDILTAMQVLAWVVFIGLLIKAGAMFISYGISIGNDLASKDLYNGLDLFALRNQSFWHYSVITAYNILLIGTQAYVAYLLTQLLNKINILKPFSDEVVKGLQKISYAILFIWIVAMVHNFHLAFIEKRFALLSHNISVEFIFMAGVVYVLAQLFKRGVEIQSENELTI